MKLTTVRATASISAQIFNESPDIQGALTTTFAEDLTNLGLDSLYSRNLAAAELMAMASDTMTFNTFPLVQINGVAATGDDRAPLLLNSIHGFSIKVSEDDGATASGFITVTVAEIGSVSGSNMVRQMVAGDTLIMMSNLGWPALSGSLISIVGSAALANVKILITLFGHSSNDAGGYGS